MPFQIVRNDITNMQVDAIVNTANPKPVIGYGVDAGIHQKPVQNCWKPGRRSAPSPLGTRPLPRGLT